MSEAPLQVTFWCLANPDLFCVKLVKGVHLSLFHPSPSLQIMVRNSDMSLESS